MIDRENCKEREFLCISHPASLIANVLITLVACQTKEPNMAALLTIPQTLFRHAHCSPHVPFLSQDRTQHRALCSVILAPQPPPVWDSFSVSPCLL